MHQVYVSIGSNINPTHYICQCLDALSSRYEEITTSSVYQSDAVGFNGSPFLNLVAGFKTEEPVAMLYESLKTIEDDNQRDRNQPRFSDRTLDIDILTYDNLHGSYHRNNLGNHHKNHGKLTLPHPDIIAYPYVLAPLAELSPDLIIPGTGKSAQACWQSSTVSADAIPTVIFCWRNRLLPLTGPEF